MSNSVEQLEQWYAKQAEQLEQWYAKQAEQLNERSKLWNRVFRTLVIAVDYVAAWNDLSSWMCHDESKVGRRLKMRDCNTIRDNNKTVFDGTSEQTRIDWPVTLIRGYPNDLGEYIPYEEPAWLRLELIVSPDGSQAEIAMSCNRRLVYDGIQPKSETVNGHSYDALLVILNKAKKEICDSYGSEAVNIIAIVQNALRYRNFISLYDFINVNEDNFERYGVNAKDCITMMNARGRVVAKNLRECTWYSGRERSDETFLGKDNPEQFTHDIEYGKASTELATLVGRTNKAEWFEEMYARGICDDEWSPTPVLHAYSPMRVLTVEGWMYLNMAKVVDNALKRVLQGEQHG